jgi:superfamily I DNA and RNA helicase
VIFAAMIADGFDYVEQGGSLGHLYQMRKNTAVFIDEVQDFTEREILLMGMAATSAYHQITLAGDRCQQLHSDGAQIFDGLFPLVPRSQQNRTIFLGQNFRQRQELGALSSGFRSLILGDTRVDVQAEGAAGPATIYRYDEQDRLAEFVLKRIQSLPHHATVAVVTPTVTEAQSWFDLLNEELGAYHRSALMSRRDDLTKRINIHFTEVLETKGLEFDVIIVPNLGSFELGCAIGRNQVYVAISRAKHALMIGCATDHVDRPEIKLLEQNGLVVVRDVPSD